NGCGMLEKTMALLMERTQTYMDAKAKERINIGVIMFSNVYGFLGQTEKAVWITERIKEEYS
ncbi:MAG: cobalt-precorrin-6A synthase, partial [Oscillospiraceae bacterium]|nr:cobalt-precorrin-6A synthase [Oscillospiraceae bacterium]